MRIRVDRWSGQGDILRGNCDRGIVVVIGLRIGADGFGDQNFRGFGRASGKRRNRLGDLGFGFGPVFGGIWAGRILQPIVYLVGCSRGQNDKAYAADLPGGIGPDELSDGFDLFHRTQSKGEAHQSTLLHGRNGMKTQAGRGDVGDHAAGVVGLEIHIAELTNGSSRSFPSFHFKVQAFS